MNGYGITSLDASSYSGVEVCAPVTYDESKEVVKKDGTSSTVATAGSTTGKFLSPQIQFCAPTNTIILHLLIITPVTTSSGAAEKPAGGELIFNFMGLVWGTNDPNASDTQKWMNS